MAKELKNPKDIAIQQTGLKLKFKTDGVVASLIRSYADWLKKKPSEATFAEWAKAISFTTDKHQQAFNLVSLSLMKAIEYQLGQRLDDIEPDEDDNDVFLKTKIRYEVFAKLNEKEYNFDCNHLSNPAAMPLLADFKPAYQQWLMYSFQMAAAQAADFASDFPDYFAYEFSMLLNAKKSDFQNLLDWCKNDFNEQAQQMLARKKYKAELKKKYHQPALGEKLVALSDIYIEPGFLVFEKAIGKERLKEMREDPEWQPQEHFYKIDSLGNIHDYLLQHFIPKKPSNEINSKLEEGKLMVLLGQPGHGKSSFCYRSIHDLLKDPNFNGNAFFLRLQDADKTILDADIEQFAKLLPDNEAIGFTDWVDKKHGQPNLLFLDGLDEFYMAQSPTDEEVVRFLRNCKKLVERNEHLYIIVTSRFNYMETNKLHQEECLVFSLDVLSEEQQKTLVQNFTAKWQEDGCTLTEEQIEHINQDESQQHIKELIELPIMLQMVLMAKVPLEATASRATIDDQLFDQVLQRKWDNNKRLKKYLQDDSVFTKEDLREYLAFLAFKTFQGKKGYLRKSQMAEYKETKQFAKNFLRTTEDGQSMKQVLKDILTSFYLQESQKQPGDQPEADKEYNYVIEFMHKSLYEYLACEHIWQNTLDFFLETDNRRGKIKTRSLEEVQKQMQETYATIRHTSETMEYMKEIIANKTAQHRELAEQMGIYFSGLLEDGFIFSYQANVLADEIRFKPEQLVLNGFHTYWLIFGSLCLHEVEVDQIMGMDWEELLKRKLDNEKFSETLEFYWDVKGVLDIDFPTYNKSKEEVELAKVDFLARMMDMKTKIQANLSAKEIDVTIWIRKSLIIEQGNNLMERQRRAIGVNEDEFTRYLRLIAGERMEMGLNCCFISLFVEDLLGIQCNNINLLGANLDRIELALSNLSYANLAFAHLEHAELDIAVLEGTNFALANLSEASLVQAYIADANFWRADLTNAEIMNAQILNSVFEYAIMDGVDITNTKIEGSNFENASFENAILKNTIFKRTNLKNINIAYARVESIDWLASLSNNGVEGAEDLQRRFRVNPKKQLFKETDKESWEGYEIEERGKLDDETNRENVFNL